MSASIPFDRPYMTGMELKHISRAVSLGNISGDGEFTQASCRLMESRFRIHKVLLTPSCTAALEIAAMLYEIKPGDEFIVPAYTFVSSANAFARLGAKPVFVEIREDTLNIDERQIEAAITDKTRAICAVHYAGIACDMDAILEVAQKHDLDVVEDAAQGVHAYYHGRALGSIAPVGAFSFHSTKNYTCGEGGAICINDPDLVERAEIIREKGTNRSKFLRGEIDKYTWVDIGSSYVPSEISAAFLFGQLEMLDTISTRRREIFEFYRQGLSGLAERNLLQIPYVPTGYESNCHMFYILMPDTSTRGALISHLKAQGIQTAFHYVPLHTSLMGRQFGYKPGDLPITEDVSERLLRLPFFYQITPEEQHFVVDQIRAFVMSSSRQ